MNTLNQRITVLESFTGSETGTGTGPATGLRPVAMAKVELNGNNERTFNCSIIRTGVGNYTFTFDSPRPTSAYVVSLTIAEFSGSNSRDDILIQVVGGTASTLGFSFIIHEQDNSTTAGIFCDRVAFVLVTDFD